MAGPLDVHIGETDHEKICQNQGKCRMYTTSRWPMSVPVFLISISGLSVQMSLVPPFSGVPFWIPISNLLDRIHHKLVPKSHSNLLKSEVDEPL